MARSYTGSLVTTLSSEYTDAMLAGYVIAALPAFSGPFILGITTAEYHQSENHKTTSLRQFEYYFAHPVPEGDCYTMNWVEHYVLDNGSPDVDTPRTYTWDGITPPDYDPDDPTTWPVTPTYQPDVTPTYGTISITEIEFACTGCE